MTRPQEYRPLLPAPQPHGAAAFEHPAQPAAAERATYALTRSRELLEQARRDLEDNPSLRQAYDETLARYHRAARACAKYALHPARR